MTDRKLAQAHCRPCNADLPALSPTQIEQAMQQLDDHWQLDDAGTAITRRFTFKGFAQATYLANLCCWLADREGHHPDIAFGWGYCQVTLTTHALHGLSENDVIWAAKLDALTH